MEAAEALALVARLDAAGLLAPDAIVSYEHDAAANEAVEVLAEAGPFALATRRAWGATVIDLLRRQPDQR